MFEIMYISSDGKYMETIGRSPSEELTVCLKLQDNVISSVPQSISEEKLKSIHLGHYEILPCEMKKEITFDVKRGDKVVVERKKKYAEKTETRNMWDIDEEWPAETHGASMTVILWYF